MLRVWPALDPELPATTLFTEGGCGRIASSKAEMVLGIDHEGSAAEQLSVVGRDAELDTLEEVLATAAASLVMIGSPGVGKTTLWESAVAAAPRHGLRVLAARSSESEAQLPFAALIGLCEGIARDELLELPAPQRCALEAALLRAEPPGGQVQSTAIALGLLGAIRSLAAQDPLLVAVDDVQWLDRPSADLLAYAARRLGDADVRFLLARRPARAGALERVLAQQGLRRLNVGGLSFGATRRLLFERLGLTLSRQLLRRVVEVTEGNPLFALEVGRAVLEAGIPTVSDEMPLPDTIEELFGARVARLPETVRRVLLAVALSAGPGVDQVIAVTEPGALEDALDHGVVVAERGRVRAAHPLLGAAARRQSRARERRELHLALAAVSPEEQLRVVHLALATSGADAELAARVAAAGEDAWARGARGQAVVLAEHALRLTPPHAEDRPARILSLAERLDDAGELRRMTNLLEEALPTLPGGRLRARALLLLGDGAGVASMQEQNRYLARALAECERDANMRAYLLAKMAVNNAAGAVAHLRVAQTQARSALEHATEPRVLRYALSALAWCRALSGQAVDDLCRRSRVADDPTAYVSATPERVAGKRLMWRGELAEAQALFSTLSALSDQRGEPTSYAMVRLHRCEVALRSGDFATAALLLDEWSESADFGTQFRPQYHRCRALLAAGRGDAEQAKRWATETIERARLADCRYDELEAMRARGVALLFEHAWEPAAQDLRAVWEYCEREEVLEPGAFPVAADLVEALVKLEEIAPAQRVIARLSELAARQRHPWAEVAAKRGRGLVALASQPQDEAAGALLQDAAAGFEHLGMPCEAARCRLELGRALRRAKRWRGARETLETAAAAFAVLDAPGWAERAREELARVSARRPRADARSLTPSEQRVAQLAARGLANKQIARDLHVTVNTVEVHLARAYAKLGVHSRSQLSQALPTSP